MDEFVVPIFCTKEEHFLKLQQQEQQQQQQQQQQEQPQQHQHHLQPHSHHIDKRYSDKHCREGIIYDLLFNRTYCFIMSNCCEST